jgi:ferredoxin-type protein NapH
VNRKGQVWPAFYVLGYFIAVGLVVWLLDGKVGQFIFLGLIGLSTGAGFIIHARACPGRKRIGRKLTLALVGLSLFLGAGVFGRESFQLEGFFFHVLAGAFGGVVTHYLVAKILGPLALGRAWCGWGCWIWMVFDYLPWKRSPGRKQGWSSLRSAHFGLSLGVVVLLIYGFRYDHGFEWKHTDGLWWFLGGCGIYYAAGITLATLLKDNRAFCKYVCPVTVFLRAGNRFSLLKVSGNPKSCTRCGSCDKACPMDIKISALVKAGSRVLDAECVLCQTCIGVCPRGNLGLSIGIDICTGNR